MAFSNKLPNLYNKELSAGPASMISKTQAMFSVDGKQVLSRDYG